MMDPLTAQQLFSPQDSSRWAYQLNRRLRVALHDGATDGPYVYLQEETSGGWIEWRVDRTLGSDIPHPAVLHPGHLTLFRIVQRRPLGSGFSAALRRARMRTANDPAYIQIYGFNCRRASILSALGGAFLGIALAAQSINGPHLLLAGAAAGVISTGVWQWHTRLGARELRIWEYGRSDPAMPAVLGALRQIERDAESLPEFGPELPIADVARSIGWELFDPTLTHQRLSEIVDETCHLKLAVNDLLEAQAQNAAWMAGLVDTPSENSRSGIAFELPGVVLPVELSWAEKVQARADAIRIVNDQNRRDLGDL